MDKWKEVELEKMKVGGNRRAKEFLANQSDWSDSANITTKYNSKAAALYRDKVTTEANGGSWSEETSSAKNYKSSYIGGSSSGASNSSYSGGVKTSKSYASGMSDYSASSGGGYQSGGAPDFNSSEFKSQKEDFFSRKQAENSMRRDDLPPSQGGKYAGFGNQVSQPPPRSFSTQDFISGNLGGLTNSISNFSLGSASGLGSRVAEVGWKFTNLAGQKASELSEAVTEKVKDGNLLSDITTGASSIAGKVTDVVNKKGGLDLSSLWGTTRSDYLPCEDSGLVHQSSGGYGGYQDSCYQDISPDHQTGFSGFGQDDRGSEKWEDWTESGWSDDSPARSAQPSKKKSAGASKSRNKDSGSLIDFDNNSSAGASKKQDDGWNNNWEDDAWESLNN